MNIQDLELLLQKHYLCWNYVVVPDLLRLERSIVSFCLTTCIHLTLRNFQWRRVYLLAILEFLLDNRPRHCNWNFRPDTWCGLPFIFHRDCLSPHQFDR